MSEPDNNDAHVALIVEDDDIVARLLSFILEREGFDVVRCNDGREAIKTMDSMSPPDIALLDIMLPYVSGFELIKKFRHQPGWEHLPILMLSSKGHEKDIALALDSGANDYVVKPFQPDELKARLRRLLRIKK